MEEGGGGEEKGSFSPSPLFLFRFHFSPFPHFLASRETMASDPEGQLSDQSDIPANSEVSEVVINCVVSKDNL